ncbi:hypothetical protein PFISCL1PPCAC_19040, partial [Pristionchus fissidentatus]
AAAALVDEVRIHYPGLVEEEELDELTREISEFVRLDQEEQNKIARSVLIPLKAWRISGYPLLSSKVIVIMNRFEDDFRSLKEPKSKELIEKAISSIYLPQPDYPFIYSSGPMPDDAIHKYGRIDEWMVYYEMCRLSLDLLDERPLRVQVELIGKFPFFYSLCSQRFYYLQALIHSL